jgi:hypothetical protein
MGILQKERDYEQFTKKLHKCFDALSKHAKTLAKCSVNQSVSVDNIFNILGNMDGMDTKEQYLERISGQFRTLAVNTQESSRQIMLIYRIVDEILTLET